MLGLKGSVLVRACESLWYSGKRSELERNWEMGENWECAKLHMDYIRRIRMADIKKVFSSYQVKEA